MKLTKSWLYPRLQIGSRAIIRRPLKNAVFAMVRAVFDVIDLGQHQGSHPRLGVVDHICFHPLACAYLDQIAGTAKSLAADIGSSLQVHDLEHSLQSPPSYMEQSTEIGEGKSLDLIRRELGYFKPNLDGNQWAGGLQSDILPLMPNEGTAQAVQAKGVVVIGTTRWVDNYNIPVFSNNIAAFRRITNRVSGRGGGIPLVQSMALVHSDVTKVACNLLEPSKVGGDQVQLEVERLAGEEGVTVGKGYFTDFSQEEVRNQFPY